MPFAVFPDRVLKGLFRGYLCKLIRSDFVAGNLSSFLYRKKKLTNDFFFKTFSDYSLPSILSKNAIKNIGHCVHERDAMG